MLCRGTHCDIDDVMITKTTANVHIWRMDLLQSNGDNYPELNTCAYTTLMYCFGIFLHLQKTLSGYRDTLETWLKMKSKPALTIAYVFTYSNMGGRSHKHQKHQNRPQIK